MPGRLSSSHDFSSGRSISRTRSSSVRAFCTSTVWASALKAESTAAEVADDMIVRSGMPDCGAGCGRGGCSAMRGGGSGCAGASAKNTSPCPSMVWKLGVSPSPVAAICSVRSRTSSASGTAPPGGASFPASIASTSCCCMAGGCGRRRGTGLRGGMAAGRGAGAAGYGAGLAAAGLAVSSSAMMRRMEARISSIDGSCAFAGWLIANPYSADPGNSPHDARGIERPQQITRSLDIYSDRRKYGTAYFERQRSLVDRHTSRARRRRNHDSGIILAVNYFPSGVRTPTQVSRT